jgi:hypothetical protein
VHGWIEPFYDRAAAAIEPGHVWSAQPIALPPRHALKIGKVDPKDDSKLDVRVGGRTDDGFGHPPIHSLGLRSDEAIVLAKACRDRPVVVLGGTTATELRPRAAKQAATVMVVPVHAADGYDEHTRRRVRRYEFTNAFYLPACERPRFAESFARLDHVQPVAQAHLGGHLGLKLSADALDALVEWFVAFSTNRLAEDSMILDYRRERLAGD